MLFLDGIDNVAHAATQPLSNGFIDISVGGEKTGDTPVKMLLFVFLLSIAPSLVVMMTHFTYVVIVLGMTRQALGLQNLPPNQVLIGLALFISAYMMSPVIHEVYDKAWVPLQEENMGTTEALKIAEVPLKKYIIDNTYEKDLAMVLKIREEEKPESYEDVSMLAAVPSFTLTQIQKGLFTGMMIAWAFAFIDMIVSALLMYMGMMMLPPTMLSMPFKVLIFVYLGGFSKITEIIFQTVHL